MCCSNSVNDSHDMARTEEAIAYVLLSAASLTQTTRSTVTGAGGSGETQSSNALVRTSPQK
jgi:hypothetical protein